ncbi:hypothetical protein [Saccharothrix carnea]|uniref:hypothetical protein n=1 Tax=Saccharothrix carnea TaxID=1280637 RepID=UPI0011B23360|nr:hypothetical protein [Saccharothrix carnea]
MAASSEGDGLHLDPLDRLRMAQWHIDRYDRLRSSTSSRAAVLLSADAALLAATIPIANSILQRAGVVEWVIWATRGFAALAMFSSVASIAFCTNAVAAWRTTRQVHQKEIPNRFVFNWGDTLKSVDGYSDFASTAASRSVETVTGDAMAELWTVILQHKRRHKHLGLGIHFFRCGTIFFVRAAIILLLFH